MRGCHSFADCNHSPSASWLLAHKSSSPRAALQAVSRSVTQKARVQPGEPAGKTAGVKTHSFNSSRSSKLTPKFFLITALCSCTCDLQSVFPALCSEASWSESAVHMLQWMDSIRSATDSSRHGVEADKLPLPAKKLIQVGQKRALQHGQNRPGQLWWSGLRVCAFCARQSCEVVPCGVAAWQL